MKSGRQTILKGVEFYAELSCGIGERSGGSFY